jgi:1,2-dihydroxy-3-keto-5-methylthiopentene dioxygenase
MTLLQVMPQDAPRTVLLRTDDAEKISAELNSAGASFERWELAPPGESNVLTAYQRQIDDLCVRDGYQLVDVAAIAPDFADPQWPAKAAAARAKFLDEHTHDEDEVRFFASGTGCFYLHLGDRVLAVVCTPGDLLSVPAGTCHWFDMGPSPAFTAIRFFQKEDGWIGDFTSSGIASEFPSLEELITGDG